MTNAPQPEINKVRDSLDTIDAQILQLLAERRKLSGSAAETKSSENLPIRDLKREEALLLERIRQGREFGLDSHFITQVFHEIIDDSLRLQQQFMQKRANRDEGKLSTIAFHGIEGSYSHMAAQIHFARSYDTLVYTGCGAFSDVVKAVESGQAEYGILPLENTVSGGLNEIYDLLLHSQVSVVGEEKCRVEHCLVGAAGTALSNIKRIYCHSPAVSECRNFLAKLHAVHVELITDSATSVRRIKEEGDPSQAAIAGEEAARMFGLAVLQRDLADQRDNSTRYVVIARTPRRVDMRIACKTSLVMGTAHQPGSLSDALLVFRENGVNLTKLESRPVANNPGEEMFYVDFDGNIEDGRIQRALQELTRCTRFLKVLGCYPSYDLPRAAVTPHAAAQGAEAARVAPSAAGAEPAPAAPKAETKEKADKKGYKLTSRAHKESDTIIDVKGVKIGGPNFVVMAGPCSVESYEQIMTCAREAKEHGAAVLRGGCFKPRTSPYSFQGLGFEGLDMMAEAGRTYGMPIITEVMAEEDLDRIAEKADILQIGARNMQNYSLLKAVGRTHRPVMLKRGPSAPIDELLQAVEYILAGGNLQVMLCERGIRTFETATRYTLDLSAVPVLKRRTHLPIIVDPSHAAGDRELVAPLALSAKTVGAHGIIVEFHPEPEKALSDGPQALRFPQFEKLMADLYRA